MASIVSDRFTDRRVNLPPKNHPRREGSRGNRSHQAKTTTTTKTMRMMKTMRTIPQRGKPGEEPQQKSKGIFFGILDNGTLTPVGLPYADTH